VVVPVLVAGALLALTIPAARADDQTNNQWSIVRTVDGHLKVVRGMSASIAAMDATLGRSAEAVLSTEPDKPVQALGTNDPLRPQQWALDRVSYERAWTASTGAGVTVAVIDTGIEANHEDLSGSVVPGVDWASDQAQYDPSGLGMVDPAGHGTHVAGIIAAHPNNGLGIAGAAPGVKLMPIRVLNAQGGGAASNVAQGIIYAADHGARIVNMSLGGGASDGESIAMDYAKAKNVLSFAAAGNSYGSGNQPVYPAGYPQAVAVAAVNSSLGHADFSNAGAYVDLAAPGDLIVSTYGGSKPNDYAYMSGTSMATPYASAAAALIMSENPGLSGDEVRGILASTATDLGAPGRDNFFGWGLVNPALAAVRALPGFNDGTKGHGYWVVGADGTVRAFGSAHWFGDLSGKPHTGFIVAGARTPSGNGYWLAGSDGAVYSFGDARYYGSMGGHLNGAIVGMAATPSGEGYILLGNDGGIFTFGDARYRGSMGGRPLNAPVLDMTITSNGQGYWFVAGDGGIFTFGNARFKGSTGSMKLNEPMRSMTAAANGAGYWLVARDGGIFAFNVPFKGALPGVRAKVAFPYMPTVRMRALPSSDGYYMLGADGTVSAFAAAHWFGESRGMMAVDMMLAP
jgi:subtilisin family serine protease